MVKSRSTLVFFLFLLLLIVVYSPVLYFNFVFHDDALFWLKLKEYGIKHYSYDNLIIECRFGEAWLQTLENIIVRHVTDLTWLRFSSLFILSCNAYLMFLQMRRLSFSDIQAFLVISAMAFLPGFAANIFNSSYCFVFFLTILLATCSFNQARNSQKIPLPVLLLFLSIATYPSTAMFYWVMVGMYILFTPDRYSVQFRQNISRLIAVGTTGLVIYAALIYVMHFYFSHHLNNTFYNPYLISLDYAGKFQWFIQEPLTNSLNLWNIFPKVTTSLVIIGFIFISAWAIFRKKLFAIEPSKRKAWVLTCLWQTALFIIVFFLTFLPNLVAQGNAAFYRCLLPLSSLTWLLLVWALFQWQKIWPKIFTSMVITALLSTAVVYAGIKTYDNVLWYRVLPSYVEFKAYMDMAKELRSKKTDGVYVILPYHFPVQRYDEFNVLTSDFTGEIYHLIYCVLNETDSTNRGVPRVYISSPGSTYARELIEVYYKKLPNGEFIYKNINNNHFLPLKYNWVSCDHGVLPFLYPQRIDPKGKNWSIINLTDLFSLSNYKEFFTS